ncbi:hypothetical protein [Cystobacter fuscus]|uniref:hypothetical protein n=1 Tax=Cystobacter fuscus TaxID=43 RepID=UPI002B2BFF32|nr:hypothetical protein F0U63_10255 [Cystobacter fuscus]
MKGKHIIGGLFLATGLMVGGCGGMEVDTDTHDESASRQDAVWLCEVGVNWHIEYFSDASRTQWVGAYDCTCDGQLTLIGKRTAYSTSTPPQSCY